MIDSKENSVINKKLMTEKNLVIKKSLPTKKKNVSYGTLEKNPVSRTFCTIFWVEDHKNFTFQELLDLLFFCDLLYSYAISPLHAPDADADADVDADVDADSCGKHHYHILMYTKTPQRLKRIRVLISKLHTNFGVCFKVSDRLQYYRYLTHADNPEKQQFNDKAYHSNYFKIPCQSVAKSSIQDELIEYLIFNFEPNMTESHVLLRLCIEGNSDFLLEYKKNHIFYEKIIRSLQALK